MGFLTSRLFVGRVRDRIDVQGSGFEPFSIDVTCIDPYPPALVAKGVEGITRLRAERIQDTPLELFQELGRDDVLFVDEAGQVSLADALANAARAFGAEIRTRGEVERILVQPPGGSVRYDRATNTWSFGPGREDGRDRFNADEREMVVKWLSRVRGPDSKDPPIKPFPRPTGAATQVVVTEYELPWELVHIHDVAGDADGNIWFTELGVNKVGKLTR